MPTTIMIGAGDRPPGRTAPPGAPAKAPAIEVVEAEADEDDRGRRQHHADQIDLHLGAAAVRLEPEAQKKTSAETAIRMPKTGRQPMKVPSMPPIRNASTPAPARAEPSAPSAVACCSPR